MRDAAAERGGVQGGHQREGRLRGRPAEQRRRMAAPGLKRVGREKLCERVPRVSVAGRNKYFEIGPWSA
jgi:hypothetical protein